MPQRVVVIGAGINGLVAANYLRRAGCTVTLIERAERVGGACVSEVATVDGRTQRYALGASVLGLMQDFGFHDTGTTASTSRRRHGATLARYALRVSPVRRLPGKWDHFGGGECASRALRVDGVGSILTTPKAYHIVVQGASRRHPLCTLGIRGPSSMALR